MNVQRLTIEFDSDIDFKPEEELNDAFKLYQTHNDASEIEDYLLRVSRHIKNVYQDDVEDIEFNKIHEFFKVHYAVEMEKYGIECWYDDDVDTSQFHKFLDALFKIYNDPINPNHYKKANMEAIDVITTFTEGLEGIDAVDTGNILKYILRWPNKNGLEDLKKAQWYLEHLISKLEKGGNDGN